MKYFTKNIEEKIAAFIARTWVKDSTSILNSGENPAKLSTIMNDDVLLSGYVEEFCGIYADEFQNISDDTILSQAGKKRVKQIAIERALYALKNFDKHADLLQHFIKLADKEPQKRSEFYVAQLSHAHGKWHRDGFKVQRITNGYMMHNSHSKPAIVKTMKSAQSIARVMNGYGAMCIVERRLDGKVRLHQIEGNVPVEDIISEEEAVERKRLVEELTRNLHAINKPSADTDKFIEAERARYLKMTTKQLRNMTMINCF